MNSIKSNTLMGLRALDVTFYERVHNTIIAEMNHRIAEDVNGIII